MWTVLKIQKFSIPIIQYDQFVSVVALSAPFNRQKLHGALCLYLPRT